MVGCYLVVLGIDLFCMLYSIYDSCYVNGYLYLRFLFIYFKCDILFFILYIGIKKVLVDCW